MKHDIPGGPPIKAIDLAALGQIVMDLDAIENDLIDKKLTPVRAQRMAIALLMEVSLDWPLRGAASGLIHAYGAGFCQFEEPLS